MRPNFTLCLYFKYMIPLYVLYRQNLQTSFRYVLGVLMNHGIEILSHREY